MKTLFTINWFFLRLFIFGISSCVSIYPNNAKADIEKYFVDSLFPQVLGIGRLENTYIDNEGMLWLGSSGRFLYRYNGSAITDIFPSSSFVIEPDNKDRVWLEQHQLKQVVTPEYLNLKTGIKKSVRFRSVNGGYLDTKYHYTLAHSATKLWLLKISGELYETDLPEDIGSEILFTKEADFSLKTDNFLASDRELTSDSDGNLWFSVTKQLLRYNPRTKKSTDFSRHLYLPNNLDSGISVAVTPDKITWIAFGTTNQLLRIDRTDHVKSKLLNYRILSVTHDAGRKVTWLATTNGLYYIAEGSSDIKPFGLEPWQDAGIPSSTIRAVNLDKNNNLWLTTAKGIFIIRHIQDNVRRIVPNLLRAKRLELDPTLAVVLRMIPENDSILWWINRKNELIRYDKLTGQEKLFSINFGKQLNFDNVLSMAFSPPYLLITSYSGNIIQFDTRTYQSFPANSNMPALINTRVNHFADKIPNKEGKLWLNGYATTRLKQGQDKVLTSLVFNFWDATTQAIKPFTCHLINDQNAQFSENVFGFYNHIQYKNTLWTSLYSSNRLIKISLQTHTCETVSFPKFQNIQKMFQEDDDSIFLIDKTTISKLALSTKKILFQKKIPLASLDFVFVDKNNNFLLYGDGILLRYIIKQGVFEPLFVSETQIDYKAGILPFFDKDRNIFYIPNHQGILEVDVNRTLNLPKPSISFTALEINNTRKSLYETSSDISIPYDQVFTLTFVAKPLVPTRLNVYRYRFSPTKPWNYFNKENNLLLSGLAPGIQSLEMQVSRDYKTFSESKFLKINIIPPWWRSNLAYLIYTLVGMLMLYLALFWYRSKERLRHGQLTTSVFENTSEGLCVLSQDFCIIKINQALQNIVGWKVGNQIKPLLENAVVAQPESGLTNVLKNNAELNIPWKGEVQLNKADKTCFFAELTLDRLKSNDINGKYILVIQDVSKRKQYEDGLIYLSKHDHLTKLPNRLYFDDYINKLVTNIKDTLQDRYAFILMDIDEFKTINDSLGHKIGDQVLIDVAHELTKAMDLVPYPKDSLIARHSGDEFILLVRIPQHEDIKLSRWLNLLLKVIMQKRHLTNIDIEPEISASFGVAFLPDNSVNPTLLLQQADMALYEAKKQGKARYCYFSNSLDLKLRNRLEIEQSLTNKINHIGLKLQYQPKVSVKTNQIIGVEALARWQLTSGEMLFPDILLPLILPGKIDKLFGLCVVNQAAVDMVELRKIQPNCKMSINLSPKYLGDSDYILQICHTLEQYPVPTSAFIFEILEDVGIDNLTVLDNLEIFRSRQIGLSIDDFGTGYSNMFHLNKINADELKIDRSLVASIPGDLQAEKLFVNILELATRFEMQVVCEGVENKAQLDFIKQHHCEYYQGYYFSRPLYIEELKKMFLANIESTQGTSD